MSRVTIIHEDDRLLVLQVQLADGREIGLDIPKPESVRPDTTNLTHATVWWHKHLSPETGPVEVP